MDAFVAGAWRNPRRGEIFIGGQWRRLTRGEGYLTSNWRSVLSFVPPMTLSAPSEATGYRTSQKPSSGSVMTNYVTATPSGGAMPYRYAWTATNGVIITNPSQASTAFVLSMGPESYVEASANVTCTDAFGTVATATLSLYFTNQSFGI